MRAQAPTCVLFLVFTLSASAGAHALRVDALPEAALRTLLHEEPNYMLQKLGSISDGGESVLTRTFLSPAHREAARQLQAWMTAAGMHSWTDGLGNVHGTVTGRTPDPVTCVGSHYDTVVDGGKYDGALGIIVGISAVKALVLTAAVERGLLTAEEVLALPGEGVLAVPASLANATLLAHSVHIVGFADEEGVRFQSTYLGSRALAGTLAASGAMDALDGGGVSLREALAAEGVAGEASLAALAAPGAALRAYVEVHMEQGPVLEAAGARLAAVSGIAGQARLAMRLAGVQGHAGTVPMSLRRDPLPGAAEAVLALEALCAPQGQPPSGTGLVCTVGTFTPWPGASNVIPGSVQLSMDIRSQSDAEREEVTRGAVQALESICLRRGLQCEWELRHQAPAVLADADVTQALSAAVTDSAALTRRLLSSGENGTGEGPAAASGACASAHGAGAGCDPEPVVGPLVSGAGHDAAEMASVAPMGMLFVRCREGVSHSPLEYVAPDDVAAAAAALLTYFATQPPG